MGSYTAGNQDPWAPYSTYKDCSQGICSVYCPQWCYIIFPPPPPFSVGDDASNTDLSPLTIAFIGILASAFILVTYHTLVSKYCSRRGHGNGTIELDENEDQMRNEASQGIPGGLDEAVLKSITICKYKKENESLRRLPKCSHAFHLLCIDTWLKSHASCPLCRANIADPASVLPSAQAPPAVPVQENLPSTDVSTLEDQRRTNDAVLVIQDLEGSVGQEGSDDLHPGLQLIKILKVLWKQMIRSNQLEDDEDGDGVGILNLVTSPFLQEDLCSQGKTEFYDFKLMSI
ncbi:hypothetical protein NC651_039843 [Populus alba x Populus x berolinensis]|nr:hypothetical protein NC651_039843 [Populus alba x Populus x berolinensis]